MKENIKEQLYSDARILHITAVSLCTLLLTVAYLFKTAFLPQLMVYIFLLFEMRAILKEGFNTLCEFTPDKKSLVLISSFATLLHGVSTYQERNIFFLSALTLLLSEIGDAIEKKCFEKSSSHRGTVNKLSAMLLTVSLIVMVVSVIVNLFMGEHPQAVMAQAFLAPALACPCTLVLLTPISALAAAKRSNEQGIYLCDISAVEKLGTVKELIVEQRGIITASEYSLYDAYSADNDKVGLISAAAAIEAHFSHPFSNAIISAAKKIATPQLTAENCSEICGKGVTATVCGDKYFLGNKKLLRDKRITIPEAISKIDFGIYVTLYMAKNGEFAGLLLLSNKMTDGTEDALEKTGDLGIRRILLSDNGREDLKKHFDILLDDREKVLQEFKKGAKIKAMTVTEKPIADAELVALTSSIAYDEADMYADSFKGIASSLILCRKMHALLKRAAAVSALFALGFSALAAFFGLLMPFTFAAVTSLPLLLFIGFSRYELPQFTSSEEDEMFGKINYTMKIEGMSCTHCSARVKTALESLKGVSATVSLEEKNARIKCPSSTTAEMLAKAVTDVGFKVVSTERV